MSFTHLNLKPSGCYGFYKQRGTHEIKTHFIFWVFPIETLNPSFKVKRNTSNYNILIFTQSFSNLKIDLESSHWGESMMKKPFWDFEFLPFENQGDSPSSLRARPKVMTPKKFQNMGFHFFIEFNHFLSNLDWGAILGAISRKLCTQPKIVVLRWSMEELRHEEESWFSKSFLILKFYT